MVFAAALIVLGFANAEGLWGLVAGALAVMLVAALLPRLHGRVKLKTPGTTVEDDIDPTPSP